MQSLIILNHYDSHTVKTSVALTDSSLKEIDTKVMEKVPAFPLSQEES
jgi:hypothetical protein